MDAARSRASGSRSTSRPVLIGDGGQATGPSSVMVGNLPKDSGAPIYRTPEHDDVGISHLSAHATVRSCHGPLVVDVDDSVGLGKQTGLLVPLLALSTSHHAAHFSQAGSLNLGSNVICRVEVALKWDLVAAQAVCPGHVSGTVAGLETHEQMAMWAQNPGGLLEVPSDRDRTMSEWPYLEPLRAVGQRR